MLSSVCLLWWISVAKLNTEAHDLLFCAHSQNSFSCCCECFLLYELRVFVSLCSMNSSGQLDWFHIYKVHHYVRLGKENQQCSWSLRDNNWADENYKYIGCLKNDSQFQSSISLCYYAGCTLQTLYLHVSKRLGVLLLDAGWTMFEFDLHKIKLLNKK